MELREALTQITEIRLQLARTEVFRGYRAAPVAFSGVLAFAAALLQAVWIPDPAGNFSGWLELWVGTAAISGMASAGEVWLRHRRSTLKLRTEITRLACEQFFPCLLAGGVLTGVLIVNAPEVLWMLPGLWAILFSMGLFASFRLLPRAIFWVALYYLAAGSVCLALGQGAAAFSPWAMAIPFGGGQLVTAAILYWTLERNDGP